MAAPSWQDLFDLGRYVLQSRRPTIVVNVGDVTDGMLAGCATMVDASIGENAATFRSTYLDGATGDALTKEASDRGVDRFQGAPALGSVTFARASFAAGAGTIPAGFIVGSEADQTGNFSTYTTDTPAVFSPTALSVTVNVTCTKDGPQGNVGAGTVTRMLAGDVGAAFDPSITVTNAALFSGGSNQESDEDLRARAKLFFLTQVRGTGDALIEGAKTVPQVRRASVVSDTSTGVVTLYVSDEDGNANAAMIAAVEAVMPLWEPVDAIVNVVGAVLLIVNIDITLTLKFGVDVNAIIDKVRQAIVSRLNLMNPGDTLYREMISTAAENVDKTNILNVRVNTPAVNLTPTATQVIRTTENNITTS